MKNRIYVFIYLFIFIFSYPSTSTEAQINSFGMGTNLGLSQIKGGSPYQSSFSSALFVGIVPSILPDISFRLGIQYSRKVEYFLPEDRRNRYYPFITVFFLKGFLNQYITESLFIEEGIGVLLLNDRIFSDRNEWNYGLGLNVLGGLDLRNGRAGGFLTGIGAEFGQTFNNSQTSFYAVYLQLTYNFSL